MNKLICILILFLATGQLLGQNCSSLNAPTSIADSCQLSPFLCGNYLENYCGTNAGLTDDAFGQSSGFLRLSPCAEHLELRISVSNCTAGGSGLIFRLYPNGCNPNTALSLITINENTTSILSTQNLDALENYLLAVSGVQGSQCEFNIQVVGGMGTALPGPPNCDCAPTYNIEGPNYIYNYDTVYYSVDIPHCTLSFGDPIGGNGEYCPPPTACPASLDSFVAVWHIPSVMHFVGDSTGLTVALQVNSDYMGMDSLRLDTIKVSWILLSSIAPDTLIFCDCPNAINCLSPSDTGKPMIITIGNMVEKQFCTLSCTHPTCIIDGITYDTPGTYTYDSIPGVIVIVTIYENDVTPLVPNKTICQGSATQLTVLNVESAYTYQWSTGQTSTSISVAPTTTTSYTVTATAGDTCVFTTTVFVAVLPIINTSIGQIGVLSCAQPCIVYQGNTYCQAGNYSVQVGQCSTQFFSIGFDPTISQTTLPPVTICEGDCYDFFGQQVCTSTTVSHVENCTNFIQKVNVKSNDTVYIGMLEKLSCGQTCYKYKNINYCAPGEYAVPDDPCGFVTFEIGFEKDTVKLGEVGKITCAQNCVTYGGTSYCQPGTYSIEDQCVVRVFSIGDNQIVPVCTTPFPDCLPSNTHFTVAFSIEGLPPYKINGVPISGNYFLSGPLPNGEQYAFIVEQTNGCQAVVSGTYDCAQFCITDAGRLSGEILHGCAGQTAVQVQSLELPTLAPGDVQDFVLQTFDGIVLTHNTTGNFAFDPATMSFDEIYLAICSVGPPDSTGIPDSANACTDTSSTQPIVFHALPRVAVSGDSSLCEGGMLILSAKGADTYIWNDGSTAAILEIPGVEEMHEGTYSVVGTDANGCTGEDSTTVVVRPQQSEGCCRPQLPNAFTPNGDDANDTFIPILPDCNKLEYAEMRIYSRWGELVFKSKGNDDRWDGTNPNGAPASSDTYVFTFRYRLEGDEEKTQKGEVTLLR